MKYRSVCSGIEGATVAWEPLGFKPVSFAEVDPFCCSLLKHHYPDVPNVGDFTKDASTEPSDILVGGTPCQDFSVAGLRAGMAGDRGNLTLQFLRTAQRTRPRWVVWENVPGILSSNNGRDFGAFLGGLGQLGYGFAYRILDAQFFGVPQRRRRVFVVGHLGDWRLAAAVLFERHSLQGDTPPSRKAGQDSTGSTSFGIDEECNVTDGGYGPLMRGGQGGTRQSVAVASTGETSHCLNAGGMGRQDYETETLVTAFTLPSAHRGVGNGHNTNYVPVGFAQNQRDEVRLMDVAGALAAEPGMKQQTYAFQPRFTRTTGGQPQEELNHALSASAGGGDSVPHIQRGMAVRRLTPRECERLQGFPDDYTKIPHRGKPAADGPRYKALGNSWAVPVVRWIGKRILEASNEPA
jgi:DNA (cytosine-5)-methyltransferase 1